MTVVELPQRIILPADRTRSPGLHLSGIIRGIALAMGWLNEKYDKQELSNKILIAIGLAWEEWVTKNIHREVTYHPPEVEVDGIYLTLDGFTNFDELEYSKVFTQTAPDDFAYLWVNEFKTTHKSSRGLGDPEVAFRDKKWFMWMAQIKGYCRAMDTRWAQLHALFMRGDHRFGNGNIPLPEYRTWAFEFTQWEIQENWEMMLRNKHLARLETYDVDK